VSYLGRFLGLVPHGELCLIVSVVNMKGYMTVKCLEVSPLEVQGDPASDASACLGRGAIGAEIFLVSIETAPDSTKKL